MLAADTQVAKLLIINKRPSNKILTKNTKTLGSGLPTVGPMLVLQDHRHIGCPPRLARAAPSAGREWRRVNGGT
eukprot:354458-Chlamydomonas_euryale.AAC.3